MTSPLPGLAIFGARAVQQASTTDATHSLSSTSTSPHPTPISSSTTTTSANTSPFFPEPSTLHPPPSSAHSNQSSGQLAKNVFEYVLLAFAILLILFLTFKRLRRLQQTDRPIRHFFSLPRFNSASTSLANNAPQRSTINAPTRRFSHPRILPPSNYVDHDQNHYPNSSSLYDDVRYPLAASPFLSSDLRSLPLAYYPYGSNRRAPVRRTRAANVDEQGRRLDSGWDPDQQSLDDKEMLPAYDKHGGPPRYADVELELEELASTDRRGGESEGRDREDVIGGA